MLVTSRGAIELRWQALHDRLMAATDDWLETLASALRAILAALPPEAAAIGGPG
jgi:hypothetical protein